MAEYIDKNELLEMIAARLRDTCNGTMSCLQMKRAVEKIPPADVAPVVHGRLTMIGADKRDRGGIWRCSACDRCQPYTSDYCPNCGARMDGDA